jgi:hypothetical protein
MTSMSNGWAFRFRVESPFGRAHAEIAGLVNEVDQHATRGGLQIAGTLTQPRHRRAVGFLTLSQSGDGPDR